MESQEVTIRSLKRVGPSTVALELETPQGFSAKPGQFILIREPIDGEEFARHYTLSSPAVTNTFELTVGVDPTGAFSGWLAERQPGDILTIEGPFGQIYYDDEGPVRVLAGGPGIGAGLGVVERAIDQGFEAALIADPGEEALIHEERFAAIAETNSVFVTSTDDGFEAAVHAARTAVPDGIDFVFGFRTFVDRAVEAIASAGGDPDEAKIESYG